MNVNVKGVAKMGHLQYAYEHSPILVLNGRSLQTL